MRKLLLLARLLVPCVLLAQAPAPATTVAELQQTFVGNWTGVLEYRDYSEPTTSTKLVQLPTWLSITPSGNAVNEHFIYDDGPTKTVEETETLSFDLAAASYTEAETGKPAQVFQVTGYDKLQHGRGDLVLLGTTRDNDKPAESRIKFTLRRNLLSWTEEVRPAHSSEPFVFRHRFTFTRAQAPVVPKP